MKNYGLPYKGSKNQIVKKIIDLFPQKENFYDLFCGGCAVTHGAMLSGKFETFTANDISDYPSVFLEAIAGKFGNEKRWISREDFYRLKDSEPYIRYCWSFGNSGDNYLYSKEVEPWKKALHYARVFGDLSLMEQFGIKTDGTGADIKRNMDEYKKKYIIWYCSTVLHSSLDVLELQKNLTERIEHNSDELRSYLLEGLKRANKRPCDVDRFLGTNGMAGHYFSRSQWEFPTREVYEKLQGFLYLPRNYNEIYGLQELLQSLQSLQSLESLERLERLQSLQSLESLERLERLQSLQSLEVLRGDYREVKIKSDSLIYCDIPYKGTSGYAGGFNHSEFYKWCGMQKELVIISEYVMPEGFVCVAEFSKRQLLSSGAGKKIKEKLFIPEHQLDLWQQTKPRSYKQLEFNFG
ncbi:hypothetical protein DYE50_01400 [Treponema ruminis]|uniref:DNA adenine methylase n=1 Tax=Treponema ruminis TaxID=744515 RepID=A0A7W8LNE6_9SPIR|nr:DNA adenine methylase [Treponema ruminis]MBB5227432.1 hypothetical protein [Treponema ruminis]QSI01239.1 hypothetical protein DYE50_01400 [Treponema ruminis]